MYIHWCTAVHRKKKKKKGGGGGGESNRQRAQHTKRRRGLRGLGRWVFQHLHEEGVDGGVSDELEEEEVLQALEADGAQRRQAEQQLGKAAWLIRVAGLAVFLQGSVDLLP